MFLSWGCCKAERKYGVWKPEFGCVDPLSERFVDVLFPLLDAESGVVISFGGSEPDDKSR